MTDRELLDFAARAAGLEVCKGEYLGDSLMIGKGHGDLWAWNPLENDGDALRLAVRLGILLRTDFIKVLSSLMKEGMAHSEATRTAIVTIAAEIGKQMMEDEE